MGLSWDLLDGMYVHSRDRDLGLLQHGGLGSLGVGIGPWVPESERDKTMRGYDDAPNMISGLTQAWLDEIIAAEQAFLHPETEA